MNLKLLVNQKAPILLELNNQQPISKVTGELSAEEINFTFAKLIKVAQFSCFKRDIDDNLLNNKPIDRNSKLFHISPFIESHGIL